jgi:hypothetical protein
MVKRERERERERREREEARGYFWYSLMRCCTIASSITLPPMVSSTATSTTEARHPLTLSNVAEDWCMCREYIDRWNHEMVENYQEKRKREKRQWDRLHLSIMRLTLEWPTSTTTTRESASGWAEGAEGAEDGMRP